MNLRRTAIALMLVISASAATAKEVLPFIENDYARAVARAKKSGLPIFIDAWAPW